MDIIVSMRPRQWTKNLLVFAALIFSENFRQYDAVRLALLTFVAFCLVSSAGYLLNDVMDRKADSLHPEKRHRPVVSGRVSSLTAVTVALILLASGFAMALATHINAAISLAIYAVNQIFYMFVARRVAILDVFVISFGFLIRAVGGAAVLEVFISPWLLVCTLLLALFLGFAKRKHELELGIASRQALGGYTSRLTDQLIAITAGATLIAYSIYAIQSETAGAHPLLILTIPFPLFGVFRYLQLVYQQNEGGNPDRALLRDPWLGGTVALWILISLFAMTRGGWGFLKP